VLLDDLRPVHDRLHGGLERVARVIREAGDGIREGIRERLNDGQIQRFLRGGVLGGALEQADGPRAVRRQDRHRLLHFRHGGGAGGQEDGLVAARDLRQHRQMLDLIRSDFVYVEIHGVHLRHTPLVADGHDELHAVVATGAREMREPLQGELHVPHQLIDGHHPAGGRAV